jgi:hypothetical protein
VVERTRADPADPFLHRVQHRDQQMPPRAGGAAAVGDVAVGRLPLPAVPSGLRRPENRLDRGSFLVGRGHRRPEPQVH